MPEQIDPLIRAFVEKILATKGAASKRARLVLQMLLDRGSVSTDEINEQGYGHPPRAIGDIRDAGVPIITGDAVSPKSGQRIAVYSFGAAADIQEGRIGGRSALPKAFKKALIDRYGSMDCITRARLSERVLQIDHRIPYRIAGDAGLKDHDVEAYMLLDGSSQRAKSWSCENCPNMKPPARDPAVCSRCYWAFPEDYDHIATEQIRRTEVAWQGADITVHDRLQTEAKKSGVTVADLLRQLARANAKDS